MAYALAPRLLRAVKNSGLSYTEVAGWQSRGRGTMRRIQTVTLHHTATPRSFKRSTDAPTLNVVKNGRAGLPGPLSQILLGRSGHVYLVAAGVSNHAGRSRATSMTNPHAVGIEAEGALEAWPAGQYRAYVLLVAALLTEFGLANGRALRHAETCSPPGRKIDASFDGPAFRRAVANVKPGTNTPAPKKEGLFGMALKASDSRTENRKIAKGREAVLRTRAKQTYSTMCSVKQGETVLVDAHLRISGLREGQIAEAWVRLGEYVKSTGTSHTRYNYPRVTVHGRAGGGDVHVAVPLVDKIGMSPKHKGGDLRLYLVVKNVSGDECVVEHTKHHILGD